MTDPITTVTIVANITTIVTTEAPNPIVSFLSFGGLTLDPTSALLVGMLIGCIIGAFHREILQILVPEDHGA